MTVDLEDDEVLEAVDETPKPKREPFHSGHWGPAPGSPEDIAARSAKGLPALACTPHVPVEVGDAVLWYSSPSANPCPAIVLQVNGDGTIWPGVIPAANADRAKSQFDVTRIRCYHRDQPRGATLAETTAVNEYGLWDLTPSEKRRRAKDSERDSLMVSLLADNKKFAALQSDFANLEEQLAKVKTRLKFIPKSNAPASEGEAE